MYLQHILDCIQNIQQYSNGISFDVFLKNTEKQQAIERNFEIIGEASSRISTEFKKLHPEIEWGKIKAMRNFIIHDYEEIDLILIWETIHNRLPALKAKIENLLK